MPKPGSSGILGFLFVLLILIIGVTLIGFFYFTKPKEDSSREERVTLAFYGPSRPMAGEASSWSVFIRNEEAHELKEAELVINFPEHFELITCSPTTTQILLHGSIWKVPRIKKRELLQVKFEGRLFGQLSEPQIFEARLTFRLAGFTSEFQKKESFPVTLLSPLALELEMPAKISCAEEINVELYLENTSQEKVTRAALKVEPPENFEFKSASLKELEKLYELEPYEQKKLVLQGYLTAADQSEANFKFQAGIFNESQFFPLVEKEKLVFLEKFDFSLKLETPGTIAWGASNLVNLSYENNTGESLYDFYLNLYIDGANFLDLAGLEASSWSYKGKPESNWNLQSKNFKATKYTISWDKELISDFSELKPASYGNIELRIPLESSLAAVKSDLSQAKILLEARACGVLKDVERSIEIVSGQTEIKVKTEISLRASACYWDEEGVQVGKGPLPPEVGQSTKYWVVFNLKNTTNPVEDILVKTTLPQGVNWTGESSSSHGLILYNEPSRTISWQIPALDAFQGGPYSLVEASFEISILPDESQVGLVLPLTEDIILTAYDRWTGQLISENYNFLDTNLRDDPRAQGKGQVVPGTRSESLIP